MKKTTNLLDKGNKVHTIRNATIDDIPLIRELTLQVWPQTYAEILSQVQIDYMLEMMYSDSSLKNQMRNGNRFVIVEEYQKPVGFASYGKIEPGVFKLHKIYILSSQQGKGTGRFVMDHVMNEIRQQGATHLQLQVNRYNKARIFYEKLGFVVLKEADFDIGNGWFMNDYIMEKML